MNQDKIRVKKSTYPEQISWDVSFAVTVARPPPFPLEIISFSQYYYLISNFETQFVRILRLILVNG